MSFNSLRLTEYTFDQKCLVSLSFLGFYLLESNSRLTTKITVNEMCLAFRYLGLIFILGSQRKLCNNVHNLDIYRNFDKQLNKCESYLEFTY